VGWMDESGCISRKDRLRDDTIIRVTDKHIHIHIHTNLRTERVTLEP
jgi:hypothetical protein